MLKRKSNAHQAFSAATMFRPILTAPHAQILELFYHVERAAAEVPDYGRS